MTADHAPVRVLDRLPDGNHWNGTGDRADRSARHGALNNGCTPEEIREVLLLVALYCGIPAANEAHRIALDVINSRVTK